MLEKELQRLRERYNLDNDVIREIRNLVILYYLHTISDQGEPISTFCNCEEDNIV